LSILKIVNFFAVTAEAAQKESTAEQEQRENEERQAAVESLQLKKFNHRRKFQRALFDHK
jgi:hypothetical protein